MFRTHSYRSASAVSLALALAGGAFGSATISGGALTINTSTFNTDQQIEVIVGPTAGVVTLQGVLGATQTNFVGVTSISITTGPAQDFVEVRNFAATVPALTINTGAGNSDVKVSYAPPVGVSSVVSTVSIIGGDGNDKAFFLAETEALSFVGSWLVRHGNGNNEAVAEVISPAASNLLAIAFDMSAGSGQDFQDLKVTSDAAAVDVSMSNRLGGNNDAAYVTLDALAAGNANLQYFGNLGGGLDVTEINNISRGGTANFTGTVDGGDGADTLKFSSEAPGAFNMTLSGGAGADSIDWFAKGLVTGTPRLLGGSGNDILKLIVDGPQVATPFIDGGSGFDIAIGFGTIVNCEQVN
jgi:hypothetical protein